MCAVVLTNHMHPVVHCDRVRPLDIATARETDRPSPGRRPAHQQLCHLATHLLLERRPLVPLIVCQATRYKQNLFKVKGNLGPLCILGGH